MVYEERTETRVDMKKKSPITSLSSERKRKPRRTFMYVFLQNSWSESFETNVGLQKDKGTTTGAYGIWNPNPICGYRVNLL